MSRNLWLLFGKEEKKTCELSIVTLSVYATEELTAGALGAGQ